MRKLSAFGLWLTIAVLTVATLVLYVDNKRTRDCIANYMVTDQKNTAARAAIADRERAAFLETLRVVTTDPDAARRLKSVKDYIALVQQDDVERRQKPILPVPTECN